MAPRHLDRLSAIDASFLHQEGPNSQMHIGGPVRAAGPAPAYDDFLDSIRARLHYVPRYRQRIVYPPAAPGPPGGAGDGALNLRGPPAPPAPARPAAAPAGAGGRDGPAAVGRRRGLQPRVPRAPYGAAGAGQRRA